MMYKNIALGVIVTAYVWDMRVARSLRKRNKELENDLERLSKLSTHLVHIIKMEEVPLSQFDAIVIHDIIQS